MSTRKKNIAIFHSLPRGGGNRVLEEIAEVLKKENKVDIYRIKHRKFKNFLDYYSYVIFTLRNRHKQIARRIDSEDFDFVLVNHDYLTKSPYILKYLKTKTVYFCHEEPREFYEDKKYFSTNFKNKIVNIIRFPLKIIDRNNVICADKLVSNSSYSKDKLEKIYAKKFEVLQLGVNKGIFNKKNNLIKKDYYLTIGSTSVFKGIDFLIESISLLPQKYKYPLVVVGNKGRDHNYITRLAKQNNVKIIRKYNISDEALSKIYNEASLLLAGAHNEPFGL